MENIRFQKLNLDCKIQLEGPFKFSPSFFSLSFFLHTFRSLSMRLSLSLSLSLFLSLSASLSFSVALSLSLRLSLFLCRSLAELSLSLSLSHSLCRFPSLSVPRHLIFQFTTYNDEFLLKLKNLLCPYM